MKDPVLTRVIFHYVTGNNDLDHNTAITSDLRDLRVPGHPSGLIIARKDPVSHGSKLEDGQVWDIVLDLRQKTWLRSQLEGCKYAVEIHPSEHDQWSMSLTIIFEFDDGTYTNFDHGSMPLGNHGGWPHIGGGTLPRI